MRHLFIINPAAGGKKNRHQQTIDHIRSVMEKHNKPYEIYVTKAPMDACEKIRAAAKSPAPLRVYACGGDGTLNECVNGAAGLNHVAVTHYPCGTGNDFIKTFDQNNTGSFGDLNALLHGTEHPIDLIDCNGRLGINICSVGIDARIGADVHKYSGIPIIGGATGYVISMLVNFVRGINQALRITTGVHKHNGNFALVCACNGRFYGGGFNPVPDAIPDDGIIDFLIVRGVSRLKFIQVVGRYAKGRYKEFDDIITHIRGNTMSIQSDKDMVINIDGELLFSRTVSFRMIPLGIRFVVPAGVHFFTQNAVQEKAF